MLALFTQFPPLRHIVRSSVEDVDLSVGTVGAHDILLDRFANSDMFNEVVEGRLLLLPFFWGDDLDNAGFHAIVVDLVHLYPRY